MTDYVVFGGMRDAALVATGEHSGSGLRAQGSDALSGRPIGGRDNHRYIALA